MPRQPFACSHRHVDRLKKWLNNPDHAGDAPCAKYGEVNGQPIRIGRHPVDGTTSLSNDLPWKMK